jgi:eight-cysteine-cluster-containing protein
MLRATLIAIALLTACGNKSKTGDTPPTTNGSGSANGGGATASDPCIKTGCSGTICAEPGNDQMSTCEWKDEYACYKTATCGRGADGKCGWVQDDAFKACLANPPKP